MANEISAIRFFEEYIYHINCLTSSYDIYSDADTKRNTNT